MVVYCRPSAANNARKMPIQAKLKDGQDKPEQGQAAAVHMIIKTDKPETLNVLHARFGFECH